MKPYTPRELDGKFDEINFLWEGHTKEEMLRFEFVHNEIKGFTEALSVHSKREVEKLDRIIDQTTKTNGRVTELELKQARREGEMKWVYMIGVPILLYVAYQIINIAFKV